MSSVPVNPIEYKFDNLTNDDVSLNLFTPKDLVLKTELNQKELVVLNCLVIENSLIKDDLKGFDLFGGFIDSFMKHKVSLDRKSRREFVDINKKDRFDDKVSTMSNIKNLVDVRQ
jgi:hypothetical protein